jgi:hypothetical protein
VPARLRIEKQFSLSISRAYRIVSAVLSAALIACGGAALAQTAKSRSVTLTWNPPNTDSKIADLSNTPPCSLPDVMKQADDSATQLVDNLQRFEAVELSQSSTDIPETSTVVGSEARFDFTAEFSVRNGSLALKEARQELDHNNANTAQLEDVGVPALALIFHPLYSIDFTFQCLGAADWNNQPAWAVAFRQVKGRPSRLMAFRTSTGSFGAKLKGRAWIARDSGQVIHLETNLIEPIGLIGLLSNAVSIDYAPVQFQTSKVTLWLPQTAVAYSQYDKYQLVKRHAYSDFKLFSVGTTSVIEKPKIPGVQTPPPEAQRPDSSNPVPPVQPKQ